MFPRVLVSLFCTWVKKQWCCPLNHQSKSEPHNTAIYFMYIEFRFIMNITHSHYNSREALAFLLPEQISPIIDWYQIKVFGNLST